MIRHHDDITFERFGRLVAMERVGYKGRASRWLCDCDCGTQKVIALSSLTRGATNSCGCLKREMMRKRRAS
jgi:hypothetical protein